MRGYVKLLNKVCARRLTALAELVSMLTPEERNTLFIWALTREITEQDIATALENKQNSLMMKITLAYIKANSNLLLKDKTILLEVIKDPEKFSMPNSIPIEGRQLTLDAWITAAQGVRA
ncbi:hypothetical protein E3E31_12110 [Thermococcus sp. M39]|uniref:hypothetical protein n=1 Tax=Thermococcus sp. M39 TaxID=1638262 RepID=UPI00143A80B4|nr:hypothetical protein [Thermococcus sp. M39]NJE09252.1 hypothetical protein [Thermococcus sp. M39]